MTRAALIWVGLVFMSLETSCTQIVVHGGNDTSVQYYPGIAIVHAITGQHNGTSIDISGVGLVVGISSITLGWHSEQTVSFPDPTVCQAIFFIRSKENLESAFEVLRSDMPNAEGICTAYQN